MASSTIGMPSEPKKGLTDLKTKNRQILGLGLGFLISLWLLLSGYYLYMSCMWLIVLPAILYLLPHFLGVKNFKVMLANGFIFTIVALLAGGLYATPAFVEHNDGTDAGGDFTDITFTFTGGVYTLSATYDGELDPADIVPKARVATVDMIGYSTTYEVQGSDTIVDGVFTFGNDVSYTFNVDERVHWMHLYMEDSPDEAISGSGTSKFFLTDSASDKTLSDSMWLGTAYLLSLVMILYFMITVFSYAIRSSAQKARDKMIEQGRLYPEGYGRCAECDAIVLPGEISCRKCGAYIDVPDDIRVKKKDFFSCSECGAEVSEDATECPRCKSVFEDVEIEVEREDGTIETTDSTFGCPDCGAEIPIISEMCPSCGKLFKKKE